MHQGSSLGELTAEIQLTSTIREEHLHQISQKVGMIREITADLADHYLGKFVDRLLTDIESASRVVQSGENEQWYAPATDVGTLRGASHTLDRIGSALYLNLPIYLPELRSSRRVSGQQNLASHLREMAALCTFVAYRLLPHTPGGGKKG